MEKIENAGNHHFLHFKQYFVLRPEPISISLSKSLQYIHFEVG